MSHPVSADLIHIPDRVQTNDFVLRSCRTGAVTEAAAAETITGPMLSPPNLNAPSTRPSDSYAAASRPAAARRATSTQVLRLGEIALHGRTGPAAGWERESARRAGARWRRHPL